MNCRPPLPRGRAALLAACAAPLIAWIGGCAQGSSPETDSSQAGTLQELPAAAQHEDGFNFFVVDENQGGGGSTLKIKNVFWGRLVDVYAIVPGAESRQKLLRDLLIDPHLEPDVQHFTLELNSVTLREELTIKHAVGTAAFDAAMEPLLADEGLQPVQPKGIGPNELPPFTAVARNAGMLVVFDDLLDAETVNRDNVIVEVGYPPTAPFEARVVPDRSHGKVLDETFHTTRALIDFSISESEAQTLGIAANGLGLPGATNVQKPNAVIRIPTRVAPSAAQFSILQNLSGHGLAFTGNGPVNGSSPTFDVVRGFRSGGRESVTQDPYDGFLPDDIPPRVVGSQRVTITLSASQPPEPELFRLDLGFTMSVCAIPPKEGDLVEVANGVMRVLTDSGPLVGSSALGVLVERADDQFAPDEPPLQGAGEFKTPWDPDAGLLPACFVRFTPDPLAPPAEGVSTAATIAVSFSEPMNPERTESFDGIQVVDPTITDPLARTVVGVVAASPSLTRHIFQPSLPFKHTSGASETLEFTLNSFFNVQLNLSQGISDLAGNAIDELLPTVEFTLEPTEPTLDTGSLSLRFNSIDENGDGAPEIRGQIVPDYSRGVILPRGMVRFSGFADQTNQSSAPVQAMTPVPGGVAEPLSIYGSRLMTVWRYHDLNLPFYDDQYFNLDIEGLAWMVTGTGVQLDLFPEFQLSVAHSRFLPDEVIVPGTGMPPAPVLAWPNSGLVTSFEQNLLDPNEDPLTVMAPKSGGYPIQPLDSFKTSSGTLMQPFPINLDKPVSQFTYWTYRDTAKLAVGGPNGGGAETNVNQPGGPPFTVHYPAGSVPTIGLPILMDFRTYPSPTTTLGLNFLTLAGVNTAPGTPSPGLPFFRAHSTGGVLPSSQLKLIEPDVEFTAQGGISGAGAPTPPVDSGFYYGNADFVTRVNRMHTIWLDTGGPSSFAELVTMPRTTEVPAGTAMSFAFRGAVQVDPLSAAQNAENLDPFGDKAPPPENKPTFIVNYFNSDPTWKESLPELSGARYIQVRMTMITSAETGAAPELDALGLSFFK